MFIDVASLISDNERPEKSVHFGQQHRLEMAKHYAAMPPAHFSRIIKFVNEFLSAYGLPISNACNIVFTKNTDLRALNDNMGSLYDGLTSPKDILWMKFTNTGHLGVVACSNDINFDIPPSSDVYDDAIYDDNGKRIEWKYNTSGILVHSVGQTWNIDFVLVFPLIGLKSGWEGTKQRHDVECGVGNYLLSKDVPIIDYLSHRF